MGQQPVIQTSFNSGEWAPALNARVDLVKYHSGAALLRNFVVDYRGGATARAGTKYILQTRFPTTVRLIPFQASFTISYVLEFGNNYIRFFTGGAPVLENGIAITGATRANPCVVAVTNTYAVGDWVFITGVNGMTQLNGNYYIISARTASTITLSDLNGNPIDSTTFTTWTSGGTVARVYTIPSTYAASEVGQIKFVQNVNVLILCHPNHPPATLTLNTATNWVLATINFGSTVAAPGAPSISTSLGAGGVQYAYQITAVDFNGQESAPSGFGVIGSIADMRAVLGSNIVSWVKTAGAASYNVYKANPSYAIFVPSGSAFGFIGNVTGTQLVDSNIGPDFTQGPPVAQSPFSGSGVASVTLTGRGSNYSSVPAVSFTPAPTGGATAQALCTIALVGAFVIATGDSYANIVGQSFAVGAGGASIVVTSESPPPGNGVTGVAVSAAGGVSGGSVPTQFVIPGSFGGASAVIGLQWGVVSLQLTSPGAGYLVVPTITFTGGGSGASATATLTPVGSGNVPPNYGNPTVPAFFQQRLVLAGPLGNPQQIVMSQTGAYFNFNVNSPVIASNAITAQLVSGQLNTIQAMIAQPQGLVTLTDKQAWLINGGTPGSPVGATQIVANSQSYNGAGFPPPIIATDNILYIQSKGSIVRNLVYNYYTQIYTGADISVLSSHLFFGFQINEWAWAEEPFKIVWCVRNDGVLLSLTFLKEQELIAWSHSDTQGLFKSVAAVTELTQAGETDAIYTAVQRIVNGNTVQYIERLTDLFYNGQVTNSWCVDAGIQFNGTPTLSFMGAQHLANATVTGTATDNAGITTVIAPFVMPVSGSFTLAAPPLPATGYTRVTVGLSFLPQLQTLALDLGEPTVQGKRKKITGVTVRCRETLGLQIGRTFGSLVSMKDLQIGNVSTMTNSIVTDLVTGDARTIIDPLWDVPGQYCIQQPFPLPASILGVIPEIAVGDTK